MIIACIIICYIVSIGIAFHWTKQLDDPIRYVAAIFWPIALFCLIPYYSYQATNWVAKKIKVVRVEREVYK